MTDRTLADADTEPAQLVGYGPLPAPIARDLVRADAKTQVWVRRVYTDPTTGDLITTDARRREFPHVARMFLTARDQTCRTPFCGAPIRHADHALAVAKGGVTDLRNGNGRCAACNLVKDTAGWTNEVRDDGAIVTTTPTGHRYTGRPPQPPRVPCLAAHPSGPAAAQHPRGGPADRPGTPARRPARPPMAGRGLTSPPLTAGE